MADKSYANWEKNGGQEHHLSSFKLTNRQMFWVCMMNIYAIKYHTNSEWFEAKQRLQAEYLHVITKSNKEFRDAFECKDFSQKESQQYKEYEAKFQALEKVLKLIED